MKIKIDLKIFLIIIFYIVTRNIKIFALTMIFILVHELGHLLTGILLGLKLSRINITILGFSIEFDNYGKERKLNKILIDSSGPAVNFIIFIFSVIINLPECSYINLILLIINLLPIVPLDGGRILKTVLLYKFSYKQTMKKIEKVSKNVLILLTFISSILVLYFQNVSFFLIVVYLWYLTIKENRKNRLIQKAFKAIENNT